MLGALGLVIGLGILCVSCGSSKQSEGATPKKEDKEEPAPARAVAKQEDPPATGLRNECLSVRETSAAALSQLGCYPGGTQSAREKTDQVRAGYLEMYGKTLPEGLIIMKSPDNEAVSEGMGFAGLLFANEPETYWQLYSARKEYFLTDRGVMAWKVSPEGRQIIRDSASDGDQDWIASELMVLDQIQCGAQQMPEGMTLESFRADIQRDLDAFWTNHIKEKSGRYLFLPTNGSWARRGDGKDVYYTNYSDPHFLRMFAEFDPSHDWTQVASDTQELNQLVLSNYESLGHAGQNPMPAKVFVQVSSSGTYSVENYYTRSKREGVSGDAVVDNEADSIRFFLRQARAAVLDDDQAAQQMLRQIVSTANITGPSSAHIYAGADGAPSPLGWNNTLAITLYGTAVLGSGEAQEAESFFCSTLNNFQGTYFGAWSGAKDYYYDQSLILQSLDLAINR